MCNLTRVLFVLVYMQVVPEPNTASDCIKVFFEDPQWPKHMKDPQLIKANQEANFFENITKVGIFLANYSCSSNRFENNRFELYWLTLVGPLKCIENNLVNCSYFGSCPRSAVIHVHCMVIGGEKRKRGGGKWAPLPRSHLPARIGIPTHQ